MFQYLVEVTEMQAEREARWERRAKSHMVGAMAR